MPFAPTKGKDRSVLQAPACGVTASAQRDASPLGALLPNARHSSQLQLFFTGLLFLLGNASVAHRPSILPLLKEPSICWAAVFTSGKEGTPGLRQFWDSMV